MSLTRNVAAPRMRCGAWLLRLCGFLAAAWSPLGSPRANGQDSVSPAVFSAVPGAATFSELKSTDWPWWRGPYRNGLAAASRLPVKFGPNENVLWRAPVPGRGHSSPIVVGDRVFLSTADEQQQIQSVVSFDLKTGEQLWQSTVSRGGFPKNNHPKNTEASSTLASDGQWLYATFFHHEAIQLSALNLDGEVIWQRIVSPFNPRMYEYGYAPSPVLYKDTVIVAVESDGSSSLAAFDRLQGTELWRTPRPANISYSSPVIARVANRDQLLISGSEQVAAYDPADGNQLWSAPGTTAATCGTMIWNKNLVFASGGYPGSQTIAVAGDGSRRVVWQNNQKCYEQSMISVDDHVYSLTDNGVLYCWQAADGKEKWRQRLSGPVSASPIFADGHIYWANESGTMYVFRANPQRFELIAENRLGDEAFASPAVSGNCLLLRIAEGRKPDRQEYLICLGSP